MSKCYIPHHTYCVCTLSMDPFPRMLRVYPIPIRNVVYKSENKPLANTLDKDFFPFMCRVPFNDVIAWVSTIIGAGTTAKGIVGRGVSKLVTRIAGTPYGAIVVGIVAIVALIVLMVYSFFACAATAQGGRWFMYHPRVKFQGENALIKDSFLSCPNGGMVTLVNSFWAAMAQSFMYSQNNKMVVTNNMICAFFTGQMAGSFIGRGVGKAVLKRLGLTAGSVLISTMIYDYINKKISENMILTGRKRQMYAEMGKDRPDTDGNFSPDEVTDFGYSLTDMGIKPEASEKIDRSLSNDLDKLDEDMSKPRKNNPNYKTQSDVNKRMGQIAEKHPEHFEGKTGKNIEYKDGKFVYKRPKGRAVPTETLGKNILSEGKKHATRAGSRKIIQNNNKIAQDYADKKLNQKMKGLRRQNIGLAILPFVNSFMDEFVIDMALRIDGLLDTEGIAIVAKKAF